MAEFISELAYQVLDSMSAVIVCGGFKHSNEKPNAVSTDVAALRGAERYAKEHKANKVNLKDCYEAWIPDPGLDSREDGEDLKGIVRMSEADGITVRVMTGRTPLGRRLAMVGDVDIVVTIYGRQHTEVVVERSLDLGLPVLPIPDAGGDSEQLLRKYRPLIAKSFAPGGLDRCLSKISKRVKDRRPDLAARAVIKLIQSAKIGRCLVLLPFDKEHNSLYASTIEPAVTRHMIALRLDRLPSSEAIYTHFADAIQTSSAVIADITILNENVMYEVGYSHGRGLKPLIFTRNEARLEQLPVYFQALNVRLASDPQSVETIIEEYLRSRKASRRLNEPSA